MSTISFKVFKDKHPTVDTDTLNLQYDVYKALKRAHCEIRVLHEELIVGDLPILLCSTATVEIREKIGRIQKDMAEVNVKLRIVQERLSRGDRQLAEQALEARLVPVETELESERDRRRADWLESQARKLSSGGGIGDNRGKATDYTQGAP